MVLTYQHQGSTLHGGPWYIPNTTKYLCVHGHFYQPPRENPFSGGIPKENGAEPFDNFNEKITAECYRSNAKLGNYEYISFNLGHTLADWLEKTEQNRDVLQQIIASERRHYERYGLSNALAQPYHHTILPLAPFNDKWTQILWGIASYDYLFKRKPHGMWLPETAVDLVTLDIVAQCGIEYVVLAPWQAKTWPDSAGPYKVRLYYTRSMNVFFYNAELSGSVSFDDSITTDAYDFANTHLGKEPFTLIATDGELYGHHKKGRDEFLYHVLNVAARQRSIEVITLERYLKLHPPTQEIELWDNSSWSCKHGVSRWDTGCDCTNFGAPGKNAWKRILRQALHALALQAYELFEAEVRDALPEPHKARNEYIRLRNGWMTEGDFWSEYGRNHCKPDNAALVYKTMLLLEAQYYMQQAFTSCGWYWESFDNYQAQNNLLFAYRAIHLMLQATGGNFDTNFLDDLSAIQQYKPALHELEPLEFEQKLNPLLQQGISTHLS